MCKVYIFKERFTGRTRRVCGETLCALMKREKCFGLLPRYKLMGEGIL